MTAQTACPLRTRSTGRCREPPVTHGYLLHAGPDLRTHRSQHRRLRPPKLVVAVPSSGTRRAARDSAGGMSPLARASAMISLHRSMHSRRQIATPGTAINMSTCGCALPQKLHFRLCRHPSAIPAHRDPASLPAYGRPAADRVRRRQPALDPVLGLGGSGLRAAHDVRSSWEPRWEPHGRTALRFSGPTRAADRNAPEVAH